MKISPSPVPLGDQMGRNAKPDGVLERVFSNKAKNGRIFGDFLIAIEVIE